MKKETITRALVFDCFGVLVEERWNAFLAQNYESDEKSQLALDAQNAMDTQAISEPEFVDSISTIFNTTKEKIHAALFGDHPSNQPLFKYIEGAKSKYKLALLSNVASMDRLREVLTIEQLAMFDVCVASGEVGMVKPSEAIFRLTTEQLECKPEECVFIDDSIRNCAGAEAAGMRTIHYQNFPQFERDITNLLQ